MVFRLKIVIFFALNLLAIGCSEKQGDVKNTKVTQQKTTENIGKESSAFLSGFESCTVSDSLLETRKKLIMKTEPLKKYDGYLSYKIEASVMKLPVIA
ncbi:MAG TPA: hypothetical protein EYG71_02850 [Leucothrix sp.]|nr:hypothetical protein [Leucothrix sp.]